MLLFAHTGLTLGAATIAAGVANRRSGKTPRFVSLSKYVDVRILMVGAMLPDIIDKPVGMYFFVNTFHNGRIFSHTLLFLLLLIGIGLVLYKTKRQVWMLTLAAGTFTHLIFDGMWGVPGTLLWPLYGWNFSSIEIEGFFGHIFKEVVSDPVIFTSEAIGLAIIIWYWVFAIQRKQLGAMLKTGRIS